MGISTKQIHLLHSLALKEKTLDKKENEIVGGRSIKSQMDTNNRRPTPPPGGEPTMDTSDWRNMLQPDLRQRIVNKIMETLKRHLPLSGQEGLNELKKIAGRFEEKIFTAATSQSDYLRKISLKMLSMESKSQNATLPSINAGNSNKLPDPGSGMQNQVLNQSQSLPIPMSANQSQARQQLLLQNIQNNMVSAGVQGSSGLPSPLPSISGITETPIPSLVGQNSNMQNISGIPQNSVGNSMGQGVPSNLFSNSQRQMPGRQQVLPQQQQWQFQNPQQYFCHQQLQHQLLKQKLQQQGNLSQSLMQPQQWQQQHLLQPNQLQSSQQSGMQTSSVMQPSVMQSAPMSGLQQNQPSSVQQSTQPMIQQHLHSVLRPQQQQQQPTGIHQQQTAMPQKSIMPQQQQQQQQLMGQLPNAANMQQNQLIVQQNSVGDMQQQQRLLGQQNNLPNLQQQQPQQLMAQQNLSSMHHQQLGTQSNGSGLQQQQHLLGTQSGNSGMQTNPHSVHMLQQQTQQGATNLLPNRGQQSQPQPPQQQMMSQIQSQPGQLQQQLGLRQQPNALQRDMQQRIQASSQGSASLLQQQNVMDQQKQLYQSQRALPETSSTQTGQAKGGDWQEEVYQKIKTTREKYLPELNEMYQKIAAKLQQPQPKSDQLEKLKIFKTMLERIITFLQVSKNNISPGFKEKLGSYEKQIVNFINTNRPRKPVSSMQQGQFPPPLMQQQQTQISQGQSHDNQMNPQMQPMNLQGSMGTMQPNNVTNMQHNSMSSISGVTTAQQNMLNSLQPSSNMDSGQGSSLSSLHQVNVGSLQQNSVSAPQQASINNLPSEIESQQFRERQMQQQLQKQQFQQQAKQQLPAQLQTRQLPQLHQINDVNDFKMRQGMGVKPGVFPPHLSSGQRAAYAHQQLKPGASFPISPLQLPQAASPQMLQHSSPQVDQQNLLSSLTETGSRLQSANSPFVPSPSALLAPSPMPGDSEKPPSLISSFPNAGNIGHQQTTHSQAAAPSRAIGTAGMSASPLLAEFTGQDVTHVDALNVSTKATVTELPTERLIKAVKYILFLGTLSFLLYFISWYPKFFVV